MSLPQFLNNMLTGITGEASSWRSCFGEDVVILSLPDLGNKVTSKLSNPRVTRLGNDDVREVEVVSQA